MRSKTPTCEYVGATQHLPCSCQTGTCNLQWGEEHNHAAGDHVGILADRRVVILLFSAFIITPLCMPRQLDALAWVSMAAVIGFAYTAVSSRYKS